MNFVRGGQDLPGRVLGAIADDTGISVDRLIHESRRARLLERNARPWKMEKRQLIFWAGCTNAEQIAQLREDGHKVHVPSQVLSRRLPFRQRQLQEYAHAVLNSTAILVNATEAAMDAQALAPWAVGLAQAVGIRVFACDEQGGSADRGLFTYLTLADSFSFAKIRERLKGGAHDPQ